MCGSHRGCGHVSEPPAPQASRIHACKPFLTAEKSLQKASGPCMHEKYDHPKIDTAAGDFSFEINALFGEPFAAETRFASCWRALGFFSPPCQYSSKIRLPQDARPVRRGGTRNCRSRDRRGARALLNPARPPERASSSWLSCWIRLYGADASWRLAIGEQMTADLVLVALNMALQQRKPDGLIHHSDGPLVCATQRPCRQPLQPHAGARAFEKRAQSLRVLRGKLTGGSAQPKAAFSSKDIAPNILAISRWVDSVICCL